MTMRNRGLNLKFGPAQEGDAGSESLDDNLEVGDVACSCGLTCERGRTLNEVYGKLEN